MSILKVDTITKADGTGSLSVPAESGTVVTTASPSLGRRNIIINGAMQVWQRGTSFSGLSPYSYFADRWQCAAATTCARDTDVPSGEGFSYSAKMTIGSAGNALRAMLEDSQKHLGSKNFTISFWAKASVANTGSIDVGDQQSQNISYTTSWQRFVFNFTPVTATAHGGTSNDYFDLGTGSACDVWFTGIQLELGSVATPFEHRSYGEELALCQRYYATSHHYHPRNTQEKGNMYNWIVPMRATPSLTYINHNSNGLGTFTVQATVNANYIRWWLSNNTDSWIAFDLIQDAEL